MRSFATVAVWALSLTFLVIGALVASEFVFMATSMDPTDIMTDAGDSWWDAGQAVAAFAGLGGLCAVGLMFWHSRRFKPIGLVLVAAQMAGVAWACVAVYREYIA